MSYNGSGTFVINSSGQPVVTNTTISSTAFNALTADLATGLSTALTKDGQTTATANIPMGTKKLTGLGVGTANTDSITLGQSQAGGALFLTAAGTADVITATGAPTITAYATGNSYYFTATGANTTAVTLNVDGLGAKAVTKNGSTALVAGDIPSGAEAHVVYDGTRFQLINPAVGGVTTWAGGTTGLTPAGATGGAVTLAGTLTVANGGTGVATITTGGLVVGAAAAAVTSLNPATAGNSIIDSGTAWTSVAKSWSYRNLIINGEMKVAQRGTSIAMTTGYAYGLDQWNWRNGASGPGRVTITQDTTVPNSTFVNSQKIAVSTIDATISADTYQLNHRIEGLRLSRIGYGAAGAQPTTISFWVRVDSTALTFPATFSASITNSAISRTYAFTFSVTATATWQKITQTIATGDVTGTWLQTSGIGAFFTINWAGDQGAVTANTWGATTGGEFGSVAGGANFMATVTNVAYLTGVQWEVGSIATPFEYRSYGEELLLCQRYYHRVTATGGNLGFGVGFVGSATLLQALVAMPCPMRAQPSLSTSGTATDYRVMSAANTTCSVVPTFGGFLTNGMLYEVDFTVAAGLTAGQAAFGGSVNSSAYLGFSAEL